MPGDILCPTRNSIIIVYNLIETFYLCVNLNMNGVNNHDKRMLNVDMVSSNYIPGIANGVFDNNQKIIWQ